jgi:transposase-like protein
MLVAYGVRRDGTRHLLAFMRSQGESQTDWEGLLQDLYRRGLEGQQLGLIVTDGCAGLAAAIPTIYPRVRHQRCWVHKMRNILEHVRKRDYDEVKKGAQAIYLAESRAHAEAAFRRFRARWRQEYGPMVRRLQRDLPEPLSFFAFPRHLWRKLRTTNVIERCFVEVRRRTRPMVCFVNVESEKAYRQFLTIHAFIAGPYAVWLRSCRLRRNALIVSAISSDRWSVNTRRRKLPAFPT